MKNILSFPERRLFISSEWSKKEIIASLSDRFMDKKYKRSFHLLGDTDIKEEHFHFLRDRLTIKRVYRTGKNGNEEYKLIAEGTIRVDGSGKILLDLRLFFYGYVGVFFMPIIVCFFLLTVLYFFYSCLFEAPPQMKTLLLLLPLTLSYIFLRVKGNLMLNGFEKEIRQHL